MGLKTSERQSEILKILSQEKKVIVSELSERFNTSDVTIRRDLDELEKRGYLQKIYGGATLNTKVGYELSFQQKARENLEAKKAIACKASEFVEEGDTIMMDCGSTLLEFARLLKNFINITVIACSIPAISELISVPDINLIVVGGLARPKSYSTAGSIAMQVLSSFNVDKAFVGVDGISLKDGFSGSDIAISEICRQMIHHAKKSFVLADHSKLDRVAFTKIADIEEVDTLIMDKLSLDERLALENRGINVISVDE